MAYIEEVITHINDALRDGLASKTVKLSLRGCSRAQPREENTSIPLFIEQTGEGEFNAFDDNYAICGYHKCASTTYGESQTQGFGDQENLKTETSQMSLVVWADRMKVKTTQEQLASVMAAIMPFDFVADKEKKYGISNTIIQPIAIDHNQRAIWGRELEGLEFMLPSESAYFQINYTIQAIYDKSCLEVCIC